jgi:hypothetical protein
MPEKLVEPLPKPQPFAPSSALLIDPHQNVALPPITPEPPKYEEVEGLV